MFSYKFVFFTEFTNSIPLKQFKNELDEITDFWCWIRISVYFLRVVKAFYFGGFMISFTINDSEKNALKKFDLISFKRILFECLFT